MRSSHYVVAMCEQAIASTFVDGIERMCGCKGQWKSGLVLVFSLRNMHGGIVSFVKGFSRLGEVYFTAFSLTLLQRERLGPFSSDLQHDS